MSNMRPQELLGEISETAKALAGLCGSLAESFASDDPKPEKRSAKKIDCQAIASRVAAARGRLILHYAPKDPRNFLQCDSWHLDHSGDEVMVPDADGDCFYSLLVTELLAGSDVRVLINPAKDTNTVVRLLRKIASGIEQHGYPFNLEQAAKLNDEIDQWRTAESIPF